MAGTVTPDLELWPIGNCQVSALIDREGAVVWSCVPRVDGDPVFCSLLNGDNREAGIWRFELVGQVTGAYAGIPFPNVFNYQNADGSVGDMPYRIENYYNWPTPSSSVLPSPSPCDSRASPSRR